MPIYKESKGLGGVYWGSTSIQRVYFGNQQVFEKPESVGPPPSPIEPVPRYWFMADRDAYSDEHGAIPCADGDLIYHWRNQGLAVDWGIQPNEIRRPTFRTGGLNGKPYLQMDYRRPAHFADLVEGSQPYGITEHNPYVVFAVTDNLRANRIANGSTGAAPLFAPPGENAWRKCIVLWTDNGSGGSNLQWFKSQVSRSAPSGPSVTAMGKVGNYSQLIHGRHDLPAYLFTDATNASSVATNGMSFLHIDEVSTFDGDLYEVLYFGGALSTAQVNQVISYLSTKYGLNS